MSRITEYVEKFGYRWNRLQGGYDLLTMFILSIVSPQPVVENALPFSEAEPKSFDSVQE